MVILSPTVATVLDKFYFKDITKAEQPLYYKCLSALKGLENSRCSVVAKDSKYPRSWTSCLTYILKVDRYCFNYEKDGTDIYVAEVFDLKTMKLLENKMEMIEPIPLFEDFFCQLI